MSLGEEVVSNLESTGTNSEMRSSEGNDNICTLHSLSRFTSERVGFQPYRFLMVAASATPPLAQTFRKTVTGTPQVGNTAMRLVGCWRLSAEPDSGRARSVWWRL